MSADLAAFLTAWVASPLRVAAIAPSGSALAALITRGVRPQSAPVLELGPGTGVFTQALRDRGVPEGELTLVEREPQFVRLLRRKFPLARVLRMDAEEVGSLCCPPRFGVAISGLPLLSMRPASVQAIMAGAIAVLRDDAAFYQFTYGPRCPVPGGILDRLGLRAIRIGRALRNLPPASVYRIERQAPATADG